MGAIQFLLNAVEVAVSTQISISKGYDQMLLALRGVGGAISRKKLFNDSYAIMYACICRTIQVLLNAFLEIGHPSPPRNANKVRPYTL